MWLTYCSYNGQYKCYVNPGTAMKEAKWYKDRDEAIRAAKEAAGYEDVMPKELISLQSMRDTILEMKKSVETQEKLKDQIEYTHTINILPSPIGVVAECTPVKKRGRPKGSKNKPKENKDGQVQD